MRRFKIFILLSLCFTCLTSCSSKKDTDTLWLPIKGLSWGMEKEDVISLLGSSGIPLQQEKATVPNRYVLSEVQTCWGFRGIVKLDFKSFSKESDAYLTAFGFYPEQVKEDMLLKKLSKTFGIEGSSPPGNGTKNFQWESKATLSDIPDKEARQRAENLIESIWNNIPFHETKVEMSRPLVLAQYTPPEQDVKGKIYLDGEHAAVAVFAKEDKISRAITENPTK